MYHKRFISLYPKSMRSVSKYLSVLLLLLPLTLAAQKNSDKLKKEQDRLEKNISNTKSLLEKTKSSTEVTLNELKLIDNQVKYREDLLQNFDNQIRSAELKIEQKDKQITELEEKLVGLKKQYKKLLIYAYKKRSKDGQMMFIFSSKSYYEALKRKKYLEKIAEIQRKQKLIIIQHKRLINKEKNEIVVERNYKEEIADEKRKEKDEILKDKAKQSSTLAKLKQEEKKLMANLQKDEAKKAEIKRKIDKAIQAEILKANQTAAKSSSSSSKKGSNKGGSNKGSSSSATGSTTAKDPVVLKEPREMELNNSFEANKGRLPWPVSTGSITEKYGRNPHPTIPNIYTNNDGVDISTNKGAQVRCVFEGEVTTVLSIMGAGKTVIVRHGNYRTIYSNLQDVYVSKGDKLTTKQSIGTLLPPDDGSYSILHFEIRQDITSINPSLWISR